MNKYERLWQAYLAISGVLNLVVFVTLVDETRWAFLNLLVGLACLASLTPLKESFMSVLSRLRGERPTDERTIPVARPHSVEALTADADASLEEARTLVAEVAALLDEAETLAWKDAEQRRRYAHEMHLRALAREEDALTAQDKKAALPVF